MSLLDRAAADLRLVATYWPGLAETRDPQAARPGYQEPALTAEQRAELDHQARLERAERTNLMPGEHPDAARPEVLDLMASLLDDAQELAAQISLASWCPVLPPPSTAFADPRPYLERAAAYLPAAATAWANGADIVHWAARQARRMLTQTSRALCLTYDGQQLDVICPWCGGRTETAPLGGERTWRVRDLLAGKPCEHGRPDRLLCGQCDGHIAVVCEGVNCEPPTKDVGTWWRGQPAWPIYEWDWLAKRVTAAEAADAKRHRDLRVRGRMTCMTDPRVLQIEEEFKRIAQPGRQYASLAELDAEDWPVCPECGTKVYVEPTDRMNDGTYLPKKWYPQCDCLPGVARR